MAAISTDNQRRRRHMQITGSAASLILLLAVVGTACTLYSPEKDAPSSHLAASATTSTAASPLHSTAKSIQLMCDSTDYKKTCVSTLNRVVKRNITDPKELVRAAVAVVQDEISTAFRRARLLADEDPSVRGAVEDCRQLFEDSEDEIKRSLAGIEHIPEKSRDIRAWLSSVMSYQQTCIDGFPDGELKVKLKEALKAARELTSNSLAIVKELSCFLEMLEIPGLAVGGRKLLAGQSVKLGMEEREELHQFDDEGFPSWVHEDNRRVVMQVNINLKPNVTVAKDGSGDYNTISMALAEMPKEYAGRYVVYVKEGVYEETVNVTKRMPNLTIFGDGGTKTVITGEKNFVDGVRTFMTATFVVTGDNFMGIGLGVRNTAGAIKHQAVAIRVQSDRSIFFECRFEGYQDTLYAQAKRQFYRSCVIAGTVDFIFGDSAAVFQNCLIVIRRPLDNQQNIVLAHGRIDRHETTGFVLHKCQIIADDKLLPVRNKIRSYLGRPWKEYARHVIMESEISDVIHPDGYLPWDGDFALATLFYGEYNNTGPGAKFDRRVKWKGVRLLKKSAPRFTVADFIQGVEWINNERGITIPVRYGMYN